VWDSSPNNRRAVKQESNRCYHTSVDSLRDLLLYSAHSPILSILTKIVVSCLSALSPSLASCSDPNSWFHPRRIALPAQAAGASIWRTAMLSTFAKYITILQKAKERLSHMVPSHKHHDTHTSVRNRSAFRLKAKKRDLCLISRCRPHSFLQSLHPSL
jgi:hypothetical protein